MRVKRLLGLLLLVLSAALNDSLDDGSANTEASRSHRRKRLLWITNDARIAFPPGTVMTITPTLALPFVRYPPRGFLSNMTISWPFTIDFDKLGITDNENPYGTLPLDLDTSETRSNRVEDSAARTADFVAAFLGRRVRKRETSGEPEIETEPPKYAFHGGERAILYSVAEDALASFGLDGKACLLRAICEAHGHPLDNLGLFGEMLKLFFTASNSPFANLLAEYVQAEKRGRSHGECWPYFKDCPRSLFLSMENRYAKAVDTETPEEAAATFSTLEREHTQINVRIPRAARSSPLRNHRPD